MSAGPRIIGQLNDGGIKTRLRRRFRVPETDTRLGSDGDSIRSKFVEAFSFEDCLILYRNNSLQPKL